MIQRFVLLLFAIVPSVSQACSLCDPEFRKKLTLREDAQTSKFIVIGSLQNARVVGEKGMTDLVVEQVILDHPQRPKGKIIVLPRWTPLDENKPAPKMLVFFDLIDGKPDPFRGVQLNGNEMGTYLKMALSFDPKKDRAQLLEFYGKHLTSKDPEVAADAFLEFAKSSDKEVAAIASKLDPKTLRPLLNDPKISGPRLGLYAYLLGMCGDQKDLSTLQELLGKLNDRNSSAYTGILAGIIEQDAKSGWKMIQEGLSNPSTRLDDRLNIINTLRFLQGSKGEAVRKEIVASIRPALARPDTADMLIEDLRQWRWWDLSKEIFALYDEKSHSSPLVRAAIIRYSLSCEDQNAQTVILKAKRDDPQLVKEILELLELDKIKPKP